MPTWFALTRFAIALLLALVSSLAPAQTGAAPGVASGLDSALEQQARQLAMTSAQTAAHTITAAGTPTAARVQVIVGQLDPRLRLAPCEHVEPYLPDGTRLWGKTRIGLRCTQGSSKWNVYLPITVKVFGTALVATSGISAGSVLSAADVAQAEVDLAEDNSVPLTQPDLAVGRTLARALKPGQSVRQAHLKARQWFAAGDTVAVRANGDGFSVAGEAQALNHGIEGQPVRMRTESGRVITGLPVGERRAELNL